MAADAARSAAEAIVGGAQAKRDDAGRIALTDPTSACPDCGHADVFYAENGTAAIYVPGRECCVPAVNRSIARWLSLAKDVKARRSQDDALVRELRQKLADTPGGSTARALEFELARTQRAVERRNQTEYLPQLDEVQSEIAHLQERRAFLQRTSP